MNAGKWMKIVGGLLMIALGLYSYSFWLPQLIEFVKGGLGIVLIMLGILVVAIGSVE